MIRKIYWFVLGLAGITPESKNLKFHMRRQHVLIEKYMEDHQVRKLQIGAQSNSIGEWLNVDITPKSAQVCYLDATKPYPINSDSFNYVFAEHMIEHISFEDAQSMVRECFRILKPGGSIRIATPNLESLLQLINHPDDANNKEYISRYHERYFPDLPFDPVYVINKLFYSFHHRFIHTYSSLKYLLETAGFENVKRYKVGVSDDPHLQNLEQHWREIGVIPNQVETIIVEAGKPVAER